MAETQFHYYTGKLIKRYNRFLCDVRLDDGTLVTAHCPNTGKLLGMPQSPRVLLKKHPPSVKRKLSYTFEWFQDEDTWVGINTHYANQVVFELLQSKMLKSFGEYSHIKREVAYGDNSKVDFFLETEKRDASLYLEVKSVHMKNGQTALFPDCPTTRGTKHNKALQSLVEKGQKAAILYLVQRSDCLYFNYAADLDPVYAKTAHEAQIAGVEVYACKIHLDFDTKCYQNPIFLTVMTR